MEFGKWLCQKVIEAVPHRHLVFIIPKILRRYFLYDRRLLSDLSRCGWDSLKLYNKEAITSKKATPGAVIAIQSFGNFLGFNSHLHVLISDPPKTDFHENSLFTVSCAIDTKVSAHFMFPYVQVEPNPVHRLLFSIIQLSKSELLSINFN